jgi:nucleoside-diphosphate-sugar epimerase
MADYDPQANYEMNVLAALHLANLCKQQGVQRYLFASSCSIYDAIHSAQAIDEQASLDETSPVDPPSIYARSKLEAEQRLLELVDQQFCPVILRKGTIYGYSPRMRYDLVLNAFVKNALKTSKIQLYNTGNVWRPLLGLEDAVQAYLLCLEAPLDVVRGEIFNVASEHYRIIDLAKLIQSSLSALGIEAEITRIDCLSRERSYRVSTEKLQRRLGFKSQASVAATLPTLYAHIRASNVRELDHPIYYNILWMRHLRESLEFQV